MVISTTIPLQQELLEKVFSKYSEDKLSKAEIDAGELLEGTYKGFTVIAYSFMCHFEEVLKKAQTINNHDTIPSNLKHYGTFILKLVAHYKDIRASYILFRNGYPSQGFSLLRDILD